MSNSQHLTGAKGPVLPLLSREETANDAGTSQDCLQQGSLSQKVSGATLGQECGSGGVSDKLTGLAQGKLVQQAREGL